MLTRAAPLELGRGVTVLVPEIHDHVVVLIVNAFKDKVRTASAGGLADLERIVRHQDFRTDVLAERVVRSRIATMSWIVASWLESQRSSRKWGAVRMAIEGRSTVRRTYSKAFWHLVTRHPSTALTLRLLARAAADDRLMQAQALLSALAWEMEMHWRSTRVFAPRSS